jgi:hypothetical protein
LITGLWLFAGVLWFIAGLRDMFAPGFFNISPHTPSSKDILFQFSMAAMFFAFAFLFRSQPDSSGEK